MSAFDYLCTGDAVLNGHPMDCLMFSYTGAYNVITTFVSYTGDFSTGSYGGQICKSDSNLPSCGNMNLWCKGPNDPLLKTKQCILFQNDDVIIGTVSPNNFYNSLKNGKSYARVNIYFGPYLGPLGPYDGYSYGESSSMTLDNILDVLPKNDNIKEFKGACLIPAIEIGTTLTTITKISAVYYCDIKNLLKQQEWKAYSEDTSMIDLVEYNKKPIYVEGDGGNNYFGDGSASSLVELIKGSYQDSCVCGYYYSTVNNANVGSITLQGLVFAFRRFYDINSPTEYIGIYKGLKKTFKDIDLIGWTSSMMCNKGEFISQIEFCYNDITEQSVKKSIGSLDLVTVKMTRTNMGIKGISRIRKINYNIPGMLYNWVSNTNDLQCCTLLTDEQYDPESIESYVCKTNKSFVVKNDFPYSYPNDNCRIKILEPYCNDKTTLTDGQLNISNDLCSAVCSLDNTNCDIGIKTYCGSGAFVEYDSNNILRPQIMERIKDPICGCMFEDDSKDFQNSLTSSLLTFLDKKMFNEPKKKITRPLRKECTLPSCKKSNYKLLEMKNKLKDKKCEDTELCIGNGYLIPLTTQNNTKVDCKRYMGGKFNCITKPEDGGLQPNLTVIADPLKPSCKNIMDNQPETFLFEPEECTLTDTWYPKARTDEEKENIVKSGLCYKNRLGQWKYKSKRLVKLQSTPSGDPNLCPPVLKDLDGNILTDENGVPLREEMEKEKLCPGDPMDYGFDEDGKKPETDYSGLINIVIIILVLFFIIFLISLIKKKLKK
jgi:hypothetical protein